MVSNNCPPACVQYHKYTQFNKKAHYQPKAKEQEQEKAQSSVLYI